ncbi:MAG: DNA polymerase Y family protein [Acidobacteriia bacterium]|nr:DNA polymerase Y family protein [Terriglobia bacterium]
MFCCLYVPDFPVQAALRLEPEDKRGILKQSAVAIFEGPAALPRVVATNERARLMGVETGMTRLQAETCGRVVIRKSSWANEYAAQSALLDCAFSFSPRVESTAPGIVILDLEGTEKLFGPAQSAAQQIAQRAAEFGLEVHVAVASNPDAAQCAARGFPGITIIPAGEEAQRLGLLPVDVLSPSTEILETLDSWGIRSFSALALLPPVPVVQRLGQQGLQLQKLARGESRRPLVPAEETRDFVESFEFEEPVETLESLTFILNRLLQQLCGRLSSRSLATNELRLRLELATWERGAARPQKELYERAWKLPLPIQDPRVLFRLVYLDLESNTLTAPIRRLVVRALPVKPRVAQGGLFVPPSPEVEQLEITLARIRGVVGAVDAQGRASVGSPKVLDSHKPESFAMEPFVADSEKTSTARYAKDAKEKEKKKPEPQSSQGSAEKRREELEIKPKTEPKSKPQPQSAQRDTEETQDSLILPGSEPIIAMRMFRPPLETTVELAKEKPVSVLLHGRRLTVLASSGPWRSSGHWWDGSSAWSRDEWDVALKTPEGTGFYRIYLDRITNKWLIEAMFD